MITADHGCDPSYTATTDHTREYVPLLVLGKGVKPGNLGTKPTFADIAATVTDLLGVHMGRRGHEFRGRNTVSIRKANYDTRKNCVSLPERRMTHAYVPYSGYQVGAALLCAGRDGVSGLQHRKRVLRPHGLRRAHRLLQGGLRRPSRDFAAIAVVRRKGRRHHRGVPALRRVPSGDAGILRRRFSHLHDHAGRAAKPTPWPRSCLSASLQQEHMHT